MKHYLLDIVQSHECSSPSMGAVCGEVLSTLMILLQLWFLHKTCEGQSAPQQTELTGLSGLLK